MRQAGDRITPQQARPKAAPKPKAQPKPKPFVLKTPHDVGTTAQPPKRGHAPTVFQEPLGTGHKVRTPSQRMVDQQRRHVARGVLHSRGVSVNRPLKKQDVNAILSDPGVKADLKSALPFIPKEHPHHGLLHNIVHGVGNAAGDVAGALTQRGGNPIRQSVFSQKQANSTDKAIQKVLGSLSSAPKALTVMPNRHLPGSSFVPGAAEDTAKAVKNELKKGRASANKYNTESIGPGGKLNPTVAKTLKAGASDIVNLPANAIQSTYLTVAHPGEVLKSTEQQLKHPVKSFEQHPVNTLLIARGLESALSRTAGAVARSGALGKGAEKFASTERPDLKLKGKATVQRRYSKGLLENRVQKEVDRRAVKKGRGVYEQPHVTVKPSRTMYHVVRDTGVSHKTKLTSIQKEGLKGSNGNNHVYLWDNPADAKKFAGGEGHILKVDTTGLDVKGSGTTRTVYGHVPADRLSSLDEAPRITHTNGAAPKGKLVAIQATEKQMLKPGLARPQAGHLNRRLDQEIGTNNGMTGIRRTKVLRAMHEERPSLAEANRLKRAADQTPNHVDDAVALVGEGILKEGDTKATGRVQQVLAREKQAIKDNMAGLDAHDTRLARDNIARINHLLNDKQFLANPHAVFHAAEGLHKAQRVTALEQHKFGDFDIAASERRAVLPFAERELGLKYNEDAKRFERPAPSHTVPVDKAEVARLKAQIKKGEETNQFSSFHDPKLERLKQRLALAEKPTQTREGVQSLSTEAILKEFEARGGNRNHLLYVPRYKDINVPSRFRGGPGGQMQRGGASRRYTGADTHTRAYDRSYTALAEAAANSAARVERHHGMNELTNLFGHKQANGEYFTNATADKEIRHQRQLYKDTNGREGGDYVKATIARQSAPPSLMQELDPAEFERTFHETQPGDSHVVLFPRPVWDRINAHENLRDKVTPEFQTATRYFRHAVLPTSPRWFAGNSIEAALRLAINDPTLARSIMTGHRLGRELSTFGPEGVRALERLQAGAASGHFGSQKFMDYFRPEDEQNVMARVHAFRQTPGPKQVGDLWDAYYHTVVGANERAESSVYFGALGKEMRNEVQSFTGDYLKTVRLGKQAYQDVARGLLNSNNRARYVAAVDKMRGRYANLSPRGRKYVTQYTPFAPWYVNAIHFIAVTLPAHHPILSGTLAALNLGTEKQRQNVALPPWLAGAIPMKGGKAIDVNRFTPAGIFATGPGQVPVAGSLHDLLLPQVNGVALNLWGKAWTGQDFPKGSGAGVALATAGNTILTTFIPFASQAQRFREGAGTAAATSTIFSPKVKAGSKQKGALKQSAKIFLPGFPQKTSSSATTPTDVDGILKQAGIGNAPSVDSILKDAGHGSAPNVDDVLKAAGLGG